MAREMSRSSRKSNFTARYERLRDLLIEARENAALSQAQLAELLGKPQSFVSKYERGERRIDVEEFLQITRQFLTIYLESIAFANRTDRRRQEAGGS